MIQIEENLIDSLKRINFLFRNQTLITECIKDYEDFSLFGKKFGRFDKGKKYKLKFFESIPFIKGNILIISSDGKCDNIDVQRYAIVERDNQKIVQQDAEFFLNKIKEFRRFMEFDIKSKIKPQDFLIRYSSYLSNIIDVRLIKILRLANSELSLDDERKLTKSEQLLFKHFHNIIKTWKTYFLNKK